MKIQIIVDVSEEALRGMFTEEHVDRKDINRIGKVTRAEAKAKLEVALWNRIWQWEQRGVL